MISKLLAHFVLIPIHPILCCTLACITGIIWQYYSLSTQIALLLAFFFLIACAISCYARTISLRQAINILLIILIFFVSASRYTNITNQHNNLFNHISNKSINIVAYVSDITKAYSKRFKNCITLNILSISGLNKFPSNYALKIYSGSFFTFKIGDTIEIKNLKFKNSANKSFEKYLIKENILNTLFVPKLEYKIVDQPKYSFTRYIATLRNRVSNNLNRKMNKPTAALFSTIFMGTKPENLKYFESIKEKFTYWGIVHYLARSGLHVVLIVLIWSLMLCFIPINFFIKHLIMLAFIILYHVLTWPSISFMRALLTFLIYKLCIIKNYAIHPMSILSLVCLLILLFNPYQLFFLDFQLSFSLTFALAWYNELTLINSRINKKL